jgi:hypothetical protein
MLVLKTSEIKFLIFVNNTIVTTKLNRYGT